MEEPYRSQVVNRLKTVRGHLDGVIRMVEDDEYCVDLMKQISALQASLERANRLVLANHLGSCFSDAVNAGRRDEAIAELLDVLKFDRMLTGPEMAAAVAATGDQG